MKKSKYVNVIITAQNWSILHRKNLYNELFSELTKWSEVVVVQQSVGIIGHFFTQFKEKIVGLITGKYKTRNLYDNVVLFTPIILFHYGLWLKRSLFSSIDIFLFNEQIKRFINKRYKDYYIILWIYSPQFFYYTEKSNFHFLVYDYMDNLDFDSTGYFNSLSASLNNYLIKKSGLVICTASYLYQKISKLNSSSIFVNNGNNYKILSAINNKNIETEISGIDKPIIGYIGGIRDWLDFDLLNFLIKELDDIYFVFIGILYRNSKKEFLELLKHENVKWIKYKDQEELPQYLRKFSVGIIPFKINEFMNGVFPNKFFEYMSCEIPVVTTALPELKTFSGIIGYSNNNKDFLDNCNLAINGGFKEKIKSYSKIACENSWERKAEIIDKSLREKLYIKT